MAYAISQILTCSEGSMWTWWTDHRVRFRRRKNAKSATPARVASVVVSVYCLKADSFFNKVRGDVKKAPAESKEKGYGICLLSSQLL